MKILVTTKRVIDPYVKVRIRGDGGGVETDGVKMAMNPFCENALEEALRWREAGAAEEVVALSVGDAACVETLRTALALGADRAIHVDSGRTPEPLTTAKIVAAVVRRENPGVVWMGKQGIDGDYNQTGQMTAALLGWGQGLFLSSATLEGGRRRCRVGGGQRHSCFPYQVAVRADRRFAFERGAVCDAPQHYEGQAQAAGDFDSGRARRQPFAEIGGP